MVKFLSPVDIRLSTVNCQLLTSSAWPSSPSSFPPTTKSASSARCSADQGRGSGAARHREGNHRRGRLLDGRHAGSRCGGARGDAAPDGDNGGKGRAVRAGIGQATGDYLIIQDADLEYDPNDYIPMLRALIDGRADAVYGSRYMGEGKHPNQSWTAYLGGRSLSLVALAVHGPLSHRHGHRAQALQAQRCRLAAARNHRIRDRSRDHGAPPGSRRTDLEVPIGYSPAQQGRGKEDRPARLVHRLPHVLAISERLEVPGLRGVRRGSKGAKGSEK